MRPPVILALAAFGETATFEPVHQGHEIRPLDAEALGDLGLLLPRMLCDQRQDRELGGAQFQLGETGDEILKHV